MEVKIELKSPDSFLPVLKTVEECGMTKMCSYSSFDHSQLLALRKLRPSQKDYPTGALFGKPLPKDYLEQAHDCGATEVHLRYDTCTVQRVEATRTAGLRIMAWLPAPREMSRHCKQVFHDLDEENEACYEAIWETGVDKICCNRPNVAIGLRNALAQD